MRGSLIAVLAFRNKRYSAPGRAMLEPVEEDSGTDRIVIVFDGDLA
jgi:hypothetical protein